MGALKSARDGGYGRLDRLEAQFPIGRQRCWWTVSVCDSLGWVYGKRQLDRRRALLEEGQIDGGLDGQWQRNGALPQPSRASAEIGLIIPSPDTLGQVQQPRETVSRGWSVMVTVTQIQTGLLLSTRRLSTRDRPVHMQAARRLPCRLRKPLMGRWTRGGCYELEHVETVTRKRDGRVCGGEAGGTRWSSDWILGLDISATSTMCS